MGPTGVLIGVGAVCGSLLTIVAFMRWIIPALRRFGHLVDDLAGEPERPGVPARPGIMLRMASVEETVRAGISNNQEIAALREEMRDGFKRIDLRVVELEQAVEEFRDAANDASRDKARTWDVIDDAIRATPPPPATA